MAVVFERLQTRCSQQRDSKNHYILCVRIIADGDQSRTCDDCSIIVEYSAKDEIAIDIREWCCDDENSGENEVK